MKNIFLTIPLLFLSLNTFASDWITNRDHSEILFQVPYMGVTEVTGRFSEFEGKVKFGPDSKIVETIRIEIIAGSIDTANKMRDGHLRGGDFLMSTVHPKITFESSKISLLAPGKYKTLGDLTIRGEKKPQTVEFTLTDSLKDTWGYENKFVKFRFTIKRKDYGINWNKTIDGKEVLVGEDISIWGTFQIQPSGSKTPNSKHMIPDTEFIRNRDIERQKEKENEESSFSKKIRNLINGK